MRILAHSMVAASAVAARATGADAAALLGSDLMALVAPPRALPYLGAEARARQARQRQWEQKERGADGRRVAGVAAAAALAAAAFFAWRASSATAAAQRHLRPVLAQGANSRAEAVPLRRPVVQQAGGEGAPALSALQAALAAGVEAAARREFERHEDEISSGL